MGRRIYEEGNFVWKYVFAKQSSEQGRIYTEFGVGQDLKRVEDGDVLVLDYSDIPKLKNVIEKILGDDYKKAKEVYDKGWEGHHSLPSADADKISHHAEEICEDVYFGMMVERFVKYMEEAHEKNGKTEFEFEGEY